MTETHNENKAESTLSLLSSVKPQVLRKRWRIEVVNGPDRGRSIVKASGHILIGTEDDADLRLSDPYVSRRHASIDLFPEGVLVRDHESRNGTRLGETKVQLAFVSAGRPIRVGHTQIRATVVDCELDANVLGTAGAIQFMTRDPGLLDALERLRLAAPTQVSILLTGEPGSGRRLLAEKIHGCSSRASGPLVFVDCEQPAEEVEALLFGRQAPVPGPGAIEQGESGTVVLTSVASLPRPMQEALLRVLEARASAGTGAPHKSGPRFIFTEHRKLEQLVKRGDFLEELYYRCAVVSEHIPALRKRPQDIPVLAQYFAIRSGHVSGEFSSEALEALTAYHWPGNTRELREVIERSPGLARDRCIELADILPEAAPTQIPVFHEAKGRAIADFEAAYVRSLLARHDGRVSQAAAEAGLTRAALYALMRRVGIIRGIPTSSL